MKKLIMKSFIVIFCFFISSSVFGDIGKLYKVSEIDTSVTILQANEVAEQYCELDKFLIHLGADYKIKESKLKLNDESPTKLNINIIIYGVQLSDDSFIGCVANMSIDLWEKIYGNVSYSKNREGRFMIYEVGTIMIRGDSDELYKGVMSNMLSLLENFINDWEKIN